MITPVATQRLVYFSIPKNARGLYFTTSSQGFYFAVCAMLQKGETAIHIHVWLNPNGLQFLVDHTNYVLSVTLTKYVFINNIHVPGYIYLSSKP